jgi:two-component system NtrC family sensor kinase
LINPRSKPSAQVNLQDTPGPGKILLVNDSAVQLDKLFRLLDGGGFDVVLALGAEEAIDLASSAEPDLIVSDVVMPNMDGIELCRKLKLDPGTAGTPFLLVTALRYDDSGIVAGLEAGADDYIDVNAPRTLLLKKAEKLIGDRRKALAYNRARMELADSEEKYRTVLDATDAGYYEIGLDGKLTFFNRALCSLLQYSEEELTGIDTWLGDGAGNIDLHDTARAGDGHVSWDERKVVRKDGDIRTVEVSASPILNHQGKPQGFRGIVRDVTERKRNEEALRMQSRVLENMTEGVTLSDENGFILYTNPAADEMFRYERGELIGKHVDVLNTSVPGQNAQLAGGVAEELKERGMWQGEFHNERKDGTSFITAARITTLDIGGTRYRLSVQEDITDRKRLERQLIQSEKLAALGKLISGVAHELNNPLTSVIGYAQLLLHRGELEERTAESIEVINREAERTRRIVQNLLSFSRQHKPCRAQADLNEILERSLELRAYELKAHNITVSRELGDLPLVNVDQHQLQQVFLNIILNAEQAIRSIGEKGALTLKTEVKSGGRWAVVSIADDGPGIPPEDLTRIFDPFFTTKEVGKGTGLGLSISYGIIKEHGGIIRAESEPGRGTRFITELPLS